jgi:hypothetical protein
LVFLGKSTDLEGLDETGKAIEGAKITSQAIRNTGTMRMGLGKMIRVDGELILSKIQLHPTRQEGGSVAVEVKALFTPLPTREESEAMNMVQGD